MAGFFTTLFSTDYMPHGQCLLWEPEILWLHVISDITIALAYFSIPFIMLYIVRKRRYIPFKWIFIMYSAFIFLCGTTHLLSIWTLWVPFYRFEGFIKALTAGVSLATAFLMIPLIPRLLEVFEVFDKEKRRLESKKEMVPSLSAAL